MLFFVKAYVNAFHHSPILNTAQNHIVSSPRNARRLFASNPLQSPPPSPSSPNKYVKQQPPLEDPSTFPEWAYEQRDYFRYELIHQSKKSNARVGRIHTPHGIIDCPGFVAVATNGALKGLDFRQADEAGQQLVFCNSYHLLLQPGPEVIEGKELCTIVIIILSFENRQRMGFWAAKCSRVIAQ